MSFIVQESWEKFTDVEHRTWETLFKRQAKLLKNRASTEVLEGMEALKICGHHIPKLSELNTILEKSTGFTVIPVTGLIPDNLFFTFLSQRKFPSTCFIRDPSQMDYLEEPDIFHDVFGHVPLLVNPIFADFMEAFGHKGLEAIQGGLLHFVTTLYWFTVEFGLIQTRQGLRIYGAGITSSNGESTYALDSPIPIRVLFNLRRVLKTQYHIDAFQRTYFIIRDFQELFETVERLDWEALRDLCLHFPEIEQGVMINQQENIQQETVYEPQ